jgi:hypothetical protein
MTPRRHDALLSEKRAALTSQRKIEANRAASPYNVVHKASEGLRGFNFP